MDLLDQAQQNKDEPQTTDIPDLSSLMHPAIDTPATDSTPADSAPPTPVTEASADSVPQPIAASTTSTQPPIDTDSNPPSDPPPIPPSADQPPKPQLHRSRGILMAAIALILITLPIIGFFASNSNSLADLRGRAAGGSCQGSPPPGCTVSGIPIAGCGGRSQSNCNAVSSCGCSWVVDTQPTQPPIQPTSPPGQITTCQPGSAPNCVGVPFNSQITVQPGNICMKCVKQANNLCGQQFCDDSLNQCKGTCYNSACNSNTSEHPPLNAAPGVCSGTQYCCGTAINPSSAAPTSTPTRTPTPTRIPTPTTASLTCTKAGDYICISDSKEGLCVTDGSGFKVQENMDCMWGCKNGRCIAAPTSTPNPALIRLIPITSNICYNSGQSVCIDNKTEGKCLQIVGSNWEVLEGLSCMWSCNNGSCTTAPASTPTPVCGGQCFSSTWSTNPGSSYERINDPSCPLYQGLQARWCLKPTPVPQGAACKITGNSASACNNRTTGTNVGPCTCQYSSLGGQDCACIANNPTPTGSGVNPTPPIACQDGTGSPDPDYVLLCECPNGCYTKTDNSPGGDGRTGWVCDTGCRRVPKNTAPATECFQIDYVKTGTSNYCGVKDVSSCLKPVCQTNVPPPQPSNTPVNTPIPPTNTPALAQCQNIKIYRGGTLLLSTQYNSIKPGDQLVLATVATGTTTKARYTINNGTPQETTLKNNQGEYILNYTIPMVTVPTQFKIQSEIFTNNVWR